MYYFFHPSFVAISYTFIAQSAASGFKWNEGYFFFSCFFVLHLSCLPVFSLKCERGRCASWLPLKITDLETSLQSFFDFFLICRACLSSPLSSYNISAVHVKNLSLLTPFITAVLCFTRQIASFFVFTFMLTYSWNKAVSYHQQWLLHRGREFIIDRDILKFTFTLSCSCLDK